MNSHVVVRPLDPVPVRSAEMDADDGDAELVVRLHLGDRAALASVLIETVEARAVC